MASEPTTKVMGAEALPARLTPPLETNDQDVEMTDPASGVKSPLQNITVDSNITTSVPLTSPKAPEKDQEDAIPETQLSTPPEAELPHTPSTNVTRKKGKVTFSDVTHSQPAVDYDDITAKPSPSLPPSRMLKATRGILKASPLPIRIDNGLQSNISIMLDSMLQQLAGNDKTSRIEAYSTLTAAIKKSNSIPDRSALNEKMLLLLKFIQRDIQTPPSKEPINHSLVIQSLSLLNAMLIFPSLNINNFTDFGIFIVEHTIRACEEPKIAKEIVRNLLQTMHIQNFSFRTWNNERVRRLIHALRDMETRIPSSKVCTFRSRIFRRLLKQCKSHMMVNVEWLSCLFTDMISSIAEVHTAAIEFGYDAALCMGMEKDMTVKVMTLLATVDQTTNKTYLEFYAGKLSEQFKKLTPEQQAAEAAKEKTDGPAEAKFKDPEAVSKIWTIVMLFLRSRPLDRWQSQHQWLNIIPGCFNSSDLNCRLEANIAWARFIFIAHLHESYFTRMISQAIVRTYISQLSRRQIARKSEAPFRKAVLGGVCTTYYYTFGPNTSAKLHDRYWDATLPLFKAMTQENTHPDLRSGALEIMVSLLDTSCRKPWNEELVLSNVTYARPADIPCLDIRFIRRNIAKIHATLLPIIKHDVMNLAKIDSHVYRLCRAVSNAICSMAAKEIKVSVETIDYTRIIVDTVKSLWIAGVPGVAEDAPHDQEKAERWLSGIKMYIMLAIDGLGMLPFLEPISLNGGTSTTSFGSPSRRGRLAGTGMTNPLNILIQTFSALPRGIKDDCDYADLMDTVFTPFLTPQTGLAISNILQARLSDMAGSQIPCGFYNLVIKAISKTIDPGAPPSSRLVQENADVLVGREYKNLVKVLEIGLRNCRFLTFNELQELYTPLFRHIHATMGSTSVAITLVEPLAKTILAGLKCDGFSHLNYLLSAVAIVRSSSQPPDQTTLDNANRQLWGVPGTKATTFDPFNVLYELVSYIFLKTYKDKTLVTDCFLTMLFRETASFLERCSEPLASRALGLIEKGLGDWVEDKDARLEAALFDNFKNIVAASCNIISRETVTQISAGVFQSIFIRGLNSSHSAFVSMFADLWNHLVENAVDIQYPETLKETLLAVRSKVELVLPGLEESGDGSLGSFRHSQTFQPIPDTQDVEMTEDVPPSRPDSRLPSGPSRRSAQSPAPNNGSARGTKSRSNSRSATPARAVPSKLRHDDSQIAFVPIESSNDEPSTQTVSEHQLEVCERQREESKILSTELQTVTNPQSQEGDISAPVVNSEAQRPGTPPQETDEEPETPKTARSYESYLSQTPTPVRVAQVSMLNQDMSDVPSSPIEAQASVSRFPLISNMAQNNPVREEWPEFSSPVNSSPIKPLRLTRSQRRAAAEKDNSEERDTQESDILASQESLPSLQGQYENESTPTQATRSIRSLRSSRRSLADLPPLQMTTRSASRGSQDITFSDVPSPASLPSKRMSRLSKKAKKNSEESESQETAPSSRTRSQRRASTATETPSQGTCGRSTRARARATVSAEATPTQATRRSKRHSVGTSQSQESVVEEIPETILESSPVPGDDQNDERDHSNLVVTRSGGKRKRSDMKDTPMPRKRTRTRSRTRRASREKSMESRMSQETESSQQSTQDLNVEETRVSLEDVTVPYFQSSPVSVRIKEKVQEETKEPSSPLSELSEEDIMLSICSMETRNEDTEGEVTTIPETQTQSVEEHMPTDEEADSQILAEMEKTVTPSGYGQKMSVSDDVVDILMVEAEAKPPNQDGAQEPVQDIKTEKKYSLEDILRNIQETTRMLNEGALQISGIQSNETDAAMLQLKRALLEAEERGRMGKR